MSSKTKLGKSAKGGVKSVGPNVPDPLPPVSPVPTGTDPKAIIFPEWSDQDVNTEKWDLPKSKDKAKTSPKKGSPTTPGQVPAENNLDEPSEFVDPHLVRLPHSLPLHEWKRPSQVFIGANFIMYKESSEYPDLVSGSKHLLHSDFMRSFISAIGILEYLGNTRPTPIEFASPTFVPNTSDIPWRPWHHIYSMCKAGKGQKHNPQVNQLGKYVVRLFWMGCWRKIVIDDQLPVDLTNHVLFPILHKPPPPSASSPSKASLESSKTKAGSKKGAAPSSRVSTNEIEMWPLILCKALLKLSNLTMAQSNEMLDFDIIHSLTGWFVQKIDVTGIDVSDIWEMCAGYSDHYTWPDSTKKQEPGSKSKDSKGSKASKSSKSGKSVSNFLDENSGIAPFHLVATCSDMRILAEDHVPDISPCWSHSFLIDQTRNIPLIKPDPLPELARWKRFRWLAWAIREGIWPAPELIPIKCFKMVSVFKKCAEHVIYTLPSKEALDIKKSVAVIEQLAIEMGDGKKKDKGADAKKDKASKSSSKGSKDGKGGKGPVVVPIPPDPSLWIDFNKLGPYISTLYIFLKSSQFQTNIKITDIAQASGDGKSKADKGKKGKGTPSKGEPTFQVLVWPNRISAFRNEPIYLFMDSIDYKLIVLNLAQMGNTKALLEANDKSEQPADLEPAREASEDIDGMNKNDYLFFSDEFIQESFPPPESEFIRPRVPYAYVIIEDYDWQSLKTGNTTSFLNTYGTKTILIDIAPGRFVLRLWIKSDTSYIANIMSDSPMVAGTLEAILENMCQESERLMKLCHDISSSYGQLVQKFGTPQFFEGLVSFCKSYIPNSTLSKLELWKVHNSFIKVLVNTIKDNSPPQEFRDRVFALKVLFMNPAIKYTNSETCSSKEIISNSLDAQLTSDDISQTSDDCQQIKRAERAAVTLQAYFKKLYVKKLRSLHKDTHKDYLKIFDLLKRNYTNCFGIQVRMQICLTLIRNFIFTKSDISYITEKFALFKDLNSTIHLQHFTGEIHAASNTWLPITRKVFYCNSINAVVVKICLFCGFFKYMVRVFDNDTDEEIKRFTNNAAVNTYSSNLAGYTVLCYGWSESENTYPWKLDFITAKVKPASLIMVPEVTNFNYILQQNYRPNVFNTICRCLLSINHDVLVTFRLSTSYNDVKLYLRCVNEVGQVFGEIYGIEGAILSKILLKYVATIDDSISYAVDSEKSILSKDRRLSKSKSRSVSLTRTNSKLKRKSKSSDRSSPERTSPTGSQSSHKKSKTSITSQDVVKYKDTVYLIEGFVIDDSWPLTKSEWDIVEQIKAKCLVGPIIPEFDRESSVGSSIKFKEKYSSKPSLGSRRKSSEMKRKSFEVKVTDHPFWRLETFSNTDDNLVTTVDKRREFEIRSIKTGWYENDPERYGKSKQLRQDYLEGHYIKPEISSEHSNSIRMYSITSQTSNQCNNSTTQSKTSRILGSRIFNGSIANTPRQSGELHKTSTDENNADNFVRTLEKPVPINEMLPPLKLEDYMVVDTTEVAKTKPEEETEKFVNTPEHEEQLKLVRAQKIEDFELDQINFEDDMIKFLYTQAGKNKILDIFYKDCRTASQGMIANAYILREQVINTIIDEYMAQQPPAPAKPTPAKAAKGKKK